MSKTTCRFISKTVLDNFSQQLKSLIKQKKKKTKMKWNQRISMKFVTYILKMLKNMC